MTGEPDMKKREPGCKCHWEEGDSDCPVHNEPQVVKALDAAADFDQTPEEAEAELRADGVDVEAS